LPPPYVGITGFRDPGEVRALLDLDCGRRELMVGVLASQRSLSGGPPRAGSRSPAREDIAGIFPATGYPTVNLVHFFAPAGNNAGALAGWLEQAMHWGGPFCHGLQLNITWPQPDALKGFKRLFPDKRLVLQVGGRDRPVELEGDPQTLANRIAHRYAGLVDYVLWDASGGKGIVLDPVVLVPYLEALEDRINDDGILMRQCVAGGLSADNIELVAEMCAMFPQLSLDAEGRLHGTNGRLDIAQCRRYLAAAASLR